MKKLILLSLAFFVGCIYDPQPVNYKFSDDGKQVSYEAMNLKAPAP